MYALRDSRDTPSSRPSRHLHSILACSSALGQPPWPPPVMLMTDTLRARMGARAAKLVNDRCHQLPPTGQIPGLTLNA